MFDRAIWWASLDQIHMELYLQPEEVRRPTTVLWHAVLSRKHVFQVGFGLTQPGVAWNLCFPSKQAEKYRLLLDHTISVFVEFVHHFCVKTRRKSLCGASSHQNRLVNRVSRTKLRVSVLWLFDELLLAVDIASCEFDPSSSTRSHNIAFRTTFSKNGLLKS